MICGIKCIKHSPCVTAGLIPTSLMFLVWWCEHILLVLNIQEAMMCKRLTCTCTSCIKTARNHDVQKADVNMYFLSKNSKEPWYAKVDVNMYCLWQSARSHDVQRLMWTCTACVKQQGVMMCKGWCEHVPLVSNGKESWCAKVDVNMYCLCQTAMMSYMMWHLSCSVSYIQSC